MHQSYITTVEKKLKNKNLKKALESDIANYAVEQTQKELFNWQMSKGITSFQIETALKISTMKI